MFKVKIAKKIPPKPQTNYKNIIAIRKLELQLLIYYFVLGLL